MKVLLCFLIVNVMVYQSGCQTLSGITTTGSAYGKIITCHTVAFFPSVDGFKDLDQSPLDPVLCDLVITPYVKFSEKTNILLHYSSRLKLYKNLQDLKVKYPHLKTFLSVYAYHSIKNVTNNYETRVQAVQDILNTLRKYNFDGIEMSWYNPKVITDEEESNFIQFIKMIKKSFEAKGYLLSVQMDIFNMRIKQYDLKKIIPLADFVAANFYYYRSLANLTDAKAPLRGIDDQDERSVVNIVTYLLDLGVSNDKLLLGIPLYGYNFAMEKLDVDGVIFGDTISRTVNRFGPISVRGSFNMSYFEICLMKSNKSFNWLDLWHEKTSTPYMVDNTKIVFYENPRSAAAKVKLGIDYGLRGFNLWHIGSDDYEGACDPEYDTYVDFTERLNKMNMDSVLIAKTLANLKLPDICDIDKNNFVGYYVENSRLGLQLPVIKQGKFPMLRAVNNAVVLASQEKMIVDEMKRILLEEATENT